MFSLTVTDLEINDVLSELTGIEYPNSIKLEELTRIVFGTSTDIQRRKVRLAIAELRKRGYLIIAKRGYSMAGDNPEPVIHFINGLYSRAHKLTQEADTMHREACRKYGNPITEKIEMIPGQPGLEGLAIVYKNYDEPAFQKTYDSDGTLHNV